MSIRAQAVTPTKTGVCLLVLNAIARLETFQISSPVYTLNTLKVFREQKLKVLEVRAGIPEGFANSDSYSWGFGKASIASRIKGVEDFAKTIESKNEGTQNFTRTTVISGKENIRDFLETFRNVYSQIARRNIIPSILDQRNSLMALAFAFGMLPLEGSDVGMAYSTIVFSVAGFLTGSGFDHVFMRPFYKDRKINEAIDKILVANDSDRENYWALFSRNGGIRKDFIEKSQKASTDNVHMQAFTHHHSYIEAPSINMRLHASKKPETLKLEWVGIDVYYEKNSGSEPELHVVFRTAKDLPVFPKINPTKKKNSSFEFENAAGLQPIPIREN